MDTRQELSNMIYDIKDKLTDAEYKNIMDKIKNIYTYENELEDENIKLKKFIMIKAGFLTEDLPNLKNN